MSGNMHEKHKLSIKIFKKKIVISDLLEILHFHRNNCGKDSGSWLQWGAVQGRFQTFNTDGVIERNEYLRVRGVRERSWAPGYKEVRRVVTITAATRDGTGVQIRGVSYFKNFTQ